MERHAIAAAAAYDFQMVTARVFLLLLLLAPAVSAAEGGSTIASPQGVSFQSGDPAYMTQECLVNKENAHGWVVIATSALLLAACGGESEPAKTQPQSASWDTPSCALVRGTAALTFTTDDGETRAPTQSALPANHYTFGLAVLQEPNVLYAWGDDGTPGLQLRRSVDAGCTWNPVNTTLDPWFGQARLVVSGNVVYAWQSTESRIYSIARNGTVALRDLGFLPLALAVDRDDTNHLRSARRSAAGVQLMDSRDGGGSWAETGTLLDDPYLQDAIVLSAVNPNHALALTARGGAWVTLDGGNQWHRAAGFDDLPFPNGRSGTIGIDGQTVWLLVQDSPSPPTGPRAAGVYFSRDWGFNFARVVSESPETPLHHGGTTFWAHPLHANVVYFSFGSISPDAPSILYRYDARATSFTSTRWPTREGSVSAVAFHPTSPAMLYLALSITDPD